jgi:hypothetical protein
LLKSILWATAVAGGLATPKLAFAINIVLVWDNLDENPSFDRNGTQLMAVANAAAQVWEQLIPSPGTHTVDVSWSHLDEGELGYWKFDPFGNNNIYFRSGSDWFIDPTPLDNEEFAFGGPFDFMGKPGSQLYGTTDGAGAWFDRTDPPDALEIGYFGWAKESASTEAREHNDLFSAVLHELGHELGVGGDEFSGRYPIYPAHVSGLRNVEVVEGHFEEDAADEGFGEENGHIAPPWAVTSTWLGTGKRYRPSAVDVLVAARDSNYTSVDLQRKFVGIGTDWNAPGTWIGGRVPDSTDDAYAVHGGTVTLSDTGRADNLFVGRDSIVATGAQSLTVDKLLALEGFGDVVRINSGGSLTVDRLEAPAYSTIELSGGTLNVSGGAIDGDLAGHGTINFGGQVDIHGRVEVTGGTLGLTGSGSIRTRPVPEEIGTGVITAQMGDLKLGVEFASDSLGDINVQDGRRLIVTRDLTIPHTVGVGLYGSESQPALLTSEGADTDVTIGTLDVGYAHGKVLSRTVTLDGNVFADGHLTLASPVRTTLQSVRISGDGLLKQEGDISVTGGSSTISVETLDWGNSTPSQSNDLVINPNSTLRVTSYTIGDYRGALTVDSATLEVDSPWQLGSETAVTAGGSLALIKSGAANPVVRGAGPLTARNWIITSGGDAFIESDLTVMPTATVVVWGGSRLFLDGTTTFRGGSISGLGDLVQRGDITVAANTTIATETFDWGNSFALNLHTLAVQPGVTLTVNSAGTGNADNQFRGTVRLNGGTLAVNTDGPWVLPAASLLQVGGMLELDGSVIAPHLQGQALTVEGRINITGGAAHLDNDVVFLSTHQTDIAAGATLHVNGATTYQGGTFTGQGTLQHNGTAVFTSSLPLSLSSNRFIQNNRITVINPSNSAAIHARIIDFQTPSVTRLFTDLHLRGQAIMRPGATFEGGGTLVIEPTGIFTGGGNLGVSLENHGTVRPGFSPGTLDIAGDYSQGPDATLEIDLMGTTLGAWDLLSASGAVSLDGTLSVVLLGGFTPSLGDSFTIVRAVGGLSGTFADADFPALPAGQVWTLEYRPNFVVISTREALPGDIDLDGDVDRVDASLFAPQLGTAASSTWSTGDFNGDHATTLNDLRLLQSNFGATHPSPAALTSAVPEPGTWLVTLGMAVLTFSTATRRGALLHRRDVTPARFSVGSR